jgi:hypothetical protein
MMEWLKKRYSRLPVIKELLRINETLLNANIAHANSFMRSKLANSPRYRDRRKLNHYEHQAFSQNGEDGIFAEIFRRIGTKDRLFVEFGVGNGIENNTVFLLMQNWRGVWIEGNAACAAELQSRFRESLSEGRLKFLQSFITVENIESLFTRLKVPEEFDLLSIAIRIMCGKRCAGLSRAFLAWSTTQLFRRMWNGWRAMTREKFGTIAVITAPV